MYSRLRIVLIIEEHTSNGAWPINLFNSGPHYFRAHDKCNEGSVLRPILRHFLKIIVNKSSETSITKSLNYIFCFLRGYLTNLLKSKRLRCKTIDTY